MVYKFCIVSDEVDNFKLEIVIDSDETFLRLRNTILDSIGYSKDQLDSFFVCDDDWSKGQEITLEEMDTDSDEDMWLMEDAVLSDFIEDEGQKLIYVFDYMTDRCFFMEMKEMQPGKSLRDPLCQRKVGVAPKQFIDIDEVNESLEKKALAATAIEDLDADFYGDESFNEDEFDLEGFEDFKE